MRRAMAVLSVLAALAAPLAAQETKWVETRFTRVHLRNGNCVDGQLVSSNDREVVLRLSNAGEMKFRRDGIDRVESVRMRSLVEQKPPAVLAPPAKKKAKLEPSIDPAVRNRLDRILARMEFASVTEKDQLTRELSKQSSAAPYLACRLMEMRDEVVPYLFRALWEMQNPDMAPYVFAALDSERPVVLQHAILLSGRLDGGWSASKIRRFLTDSRPRLRAAAAEALKEVGDDGALIDILPLLQAPEAVVRSTAINTCLEIGRRAGKMELVAERLGEALFKADGEALGDLLSGAGRSGHRDLARHLVRYLNDADPGIRAKTAAALAALANPETVPAVAQRLLLEDAVPVQLQLLCVTRSMKVREFVDPVVQLLRSPDEEVQGAAVATLRMITRQDFGASYDAWSTWWEQARPR